MSAGCAQHLIPASDPGGADWIDAVRKTWDGALTIGRDGPVVAVADTPRMARKS
jgi:hypothetical protein